MNLKTYVVLLALILGACNTQSVYKPAIGSGSGYSEKVLGENYYRVQFKTITEKRANGYVLLRAAELTNEHGYDWFVVIKREVMIDKTEAQTAQVHDRQLMTRQCGLLGCRAHVATLPDSGIDNRDDYTALAPTTVALEIRFGKGIRPESRVEEKDGITRNENYDALETIERLKPSTVKNN